MNVTYAIRKGRLEASELFLSPNEWSSEICGESMLKISKTTFDDLCWWTSTFGGRKKKVGGISSLEEHKSGQQFHQPSDLEA